ncbi:MAG: ABC transporter permease [Planctomycetota bacterium]|nr:ABC transporter permease [Planctomycetota bacterium]MDW8372464.1 ABC transporter permease [Planctomycetota bacterium]
MTRGGLGAGWLSLAALALIVALCALAPWVAPEPDALRPWLGAQPPGTRSVAVPLVVRLAVGAPGPGGRRAVYEVDEGEERLYRCALRRGRLEIIGPDAQPVGELALPPTALIFGPGGCEGPAGPGVLRAGGAPPPWLHAAAPVRYVSIRDPGPLRSVVVEQDGAGRIARIVRDGQPLEALEIAGDRVRSLEIDGRARTTLHLLGTDPLGRDLWARTLYGGRLSLSVGVVATLVALVIGSLYGAIAGWRGGRTDALMVAGIDVLDAIPFLFVVILLMTVADRSLLLFFAALGCVQWLTTARIVRAQVLALAGREFILAARALGLPTWRIVLRHLLPNCLGPLLVFAALTVPAVIVEESFLSFIGLGVQHEGRPLDSWGALIQQGLQALGSDGSRSWLLLAPASMLAVALFALHDLAERARQRLDPRAAGGGS